MGSAMEEIKEGNAVIEAQLSSGYESASGFRNAFSKIMGSFPKKFDQNSKILKSSLLDTELGPMITISDERVIYLLEFTDKIRLAYEIERLKFKLKAIIVPGTTAPISLIEDVLMEN